MIREPGTISESEEGGTVRTAIIAGIVAMLVSAASASAAFVVTSKNIKNGTIQLVDISAKAKKALRGQRGSQGPQGPQGAQGVQQITAVMGQPTVVPPSQLGSASAACPEGQRPISGGFETFGVSGMAATASKRLSSGWGVLAQNPSPTLTGTLIAYAYCSPNVTLLPGQHKGI
jgi:hypothetical protein